MFIRFRSQDVFLQKAPLSFVHQSGSIAGKFDIHAHNLAPSITVYCRMGLPVCEGVQEALERQCAAKEKVRKGPDHSRKKEEGRG